MRVRPPGRVPASDMADPRAENLLLPAVARVPGYSFSSLDIQPGGTAPQGAGAIGSGAIQCNGLESANIESKAEKNLKERMRMRRQRLLRPQPDRSEGSSTLAHLGTRYVDPSMQVRGPIAKGVEKRFLTPTSQPPTQDKPLRREISTEQAAKYEEIQSAVVANEKAHAETHVPFYHAQDPRMRIAQDVYKRVYARHNRWKVPKDFHFLRFPGPNDKEFQDSLPEFLDKDMTAHGMIDDNINPTKSSIVSANLSAFGGIGHPGEETFHYFQTGRGQTPPPVSKMMEGFLPKFGLDPSGAETFYQQAEKLNDTPEGSLLQIMVPKHQVDEVAYAAHPHGLPHDDDLLDNMHSMGSIKYSKEQGTLTREKMNDEITRKLVDIRDVTSRRDKIPPVSALPVTGGTPLRSALKGGREAAANAPPSPATAEMTKRVKDRQDALLLEQAQALHHDTRSGFRGTSTYKLSSVMPDYVHAPHKLQHPEVRMQQHRMETNPDHFGGQGARSQQEVMRIQNRSNFLQARLHMSDQGMLNPYSGIKVIRHTTVDPKKNEQYEALVDQYVDSLYKNVSAPQGRKLMAKF